MTSKHKPRALVFIDWFLPGDKAGGPVRSCVNLIDHLQDEFDFSVVTRDTDYTESIPYASVKSDTWNLLPSGKRVYYISKENLARKTIETIIASEEPDVIYVNGIWSQPFTAWPLAVAKKGETGIKTIVAIRGMFASSAMAIKPLKKKAFLAYAKARGLFSGATFHATSAQEAEDAKRVLGKKIPVMVAGNLPRKTFPAGLSAKRKSAPLKIAGIARIAPEKNTLYAIESLAEVKQPVEVDFYGTVYDEAYFNLCRAATGKLPANVRFRFHDAVDSEKVPALLAEYDLLFLPTRGENFGHIILEAMQSGVPVLISDQTPWKNLEANSAGWDIPLGSQRAFAEKIDHLVQMSAGDYARFSKGAFEFASKYAANVDLIAENKNIFRAQL
jgi:glycosyltransferase involved in cell wall biosynthesis